jgi:hypothetical protein
MRNYFFVVMALLGGGLCIAPGYAYAADPARVMFFGVFHFKDAGLDVVQVEDVDIFSEENQAYLESLTTRLAAFGPTTVLLEYNPENEEGMNERYQQYLDGAHELGANEIYQLGFRIAKKAGLERVYSFDHRELQWQGQALFDYSETHNPPEAQAMREAIKSVEADEAQALSTLSLAQLLARQNDPEQERLNMDLYLLTNGVGAEEGWVGADAASSWWGRNFRMYARVQKHAYPGARVIAIGGAGHTAILKQLLEIDQRIESEDPLPYILGTE